MLISPKPYSPRDRFPKASTVKVSSGLKINTSHEIAVVVGSTYRAIQQFSPTTRKKFSATEAYAIACIARSKLGKEADQADHNLRRMVGHANMLDCR